MSQVHWVVLLMTIKNTKSSQIMRLLHQTKSFLNQKLIFQHQLIYWNKKGIVIWGLKLLLLEAIMELCRLILLVKSMEWGNKYKWCKEIIRITSNSINRLKLFSFSRCSSSNRFKTMDKTCNSNNSNNSNSSNSSNKE